MGKLTINVSKCELLRPAGLNGYSVNPRVCITVDDSYRFQTRLVKNSFSPYYNETFAVDNTHKLAVIEVCVYDEIQEEFLSGITKFVSNLNQTDEKVTMANTANNNETSPSSVLIGKCYISARRLVQKQKKTRNYYLATPIERKLDGGLFSGLETPVGIAGHITISLESDSLGEPVAQFRLNDALEKTATSQLARLFLSHEPQRVAVLDVVLANVCDATELLSKDSDLSSHSLRLESRNRPNNMVDITVGPPQLHFSEPTVRETFDQLLARWCTKYGGVIQQQPFQVQIRVEGCTNLDKKLWKTALISSNTVFAVLRTEMESFITGRRSLEDTVLWTGGEKDKNEILFTVPNPVTSTLLVILYGAQGSNEFEIGRYQLSFVTLARDHMSLRNSYLLNFSAGVVTPVIHDLLRLSMRPLNFGLTPLEQIDHVDEFYDRLGRFFRRYNVYALPHLDTRIRSRLSDLESYMQGLVVQHGREPGTAKLSLTLESISSIMEDSVKDLSDRHIRVIITFGSMIVRTGTYQVTRYAAVLIEERFVFDIVRESDMIRIDVVKASNESVVYGRVDFTCLNIQKGVQNKRKLYLVGAPETEEAYFSGVVNITMFSEEIGHNYELDDITDEFYAGRLRRYVFRRAPENLHRINLALTTVFDMEEFLAQLSATLGDEDPTYAIYCTITGCRQLRQRFGGVSPYVFVRVGIDSYQTKFVKDSTEPDYFELSEFYIDRPFEEVITLIVMDHYDLGKDEEIGRAEISLRDVVIGEPYHDFVPLQPPLNTKEKDRAKAKDLGSIGFKFNVMDLNLVDRTRARIVQESIKVRRRRDRHSYSRADTTNLYTRDTHLRTLSADNDNESTVEEHEETRSAAAAAGNKWNDWKKKIGSHRMFNWTAAEKRQAQLQQQANSAKNSVASDEETRSLVSISTISTVPLETAVRPTVSLMDECVMGVEDFCSSNRSSHLSSVVNSEEEFFESPEDDFIPPPSSQDAGESSLLDSRFEKSRFSTGDGDVPKEASLKVRVLYCRELCNTARRQPCPYIALSTLRETHCTSTKINTVNPRYNEEFEFHIAEPSKDILHISVYVDTPYGAKALGHACISLLNVQNGASRTRWISLVVNAHSNNAAEQGSICLSLTAKNFGLNYAPNTAAEDRIRDIIREHLKCHIPKQLHYLEVYVGECCSQEGRFQSMFVSALTSGYNRLLGDEKEGQKEGRNHRKFGAAGKETANVEISVKEVDKLHIGNIIPAAVSCLVKVKVQGKVQGKTSVSIGEKGNVKFHEGPIHFVLQDPQTSVIRLVVYAGSSKLKVGECFISLLDIQRGVELVRTHYISPIPYDPQGPAAIGFITVGVKSDDFGMTTPAGTAMIGGNTAETAAKLKEAQYERLARYFYYYCPKELSAVAIKYATTLNVEAYMQKLIAVHGAEPGNYSLKVTIRRCTTTDMDTLLDLYGKKKSRHSSKKGNLNLFCVLSCGLDNWRTSIVRSSSTEFVFYEVFRVSVGLPMVEPLSVRLMQFSSSDSQELGHASVILDRVHMKKNTIRRLPLIRKTDNKHSSIVGNVELDLYAEDFGINDEQQQSAPQSATKKSGVSFQERQASTILFVPSPEGEVPSDQMDSPLPGGGRGGAQPSTNRSSSEEADALRFATTYNDFTYPPNMCIDEEDSAPQPLIGNQDSHSHEPEQGDAFRGTFNSTMQAMDRRESIPTSGTMHINFISFGFNEIPEKELTIRVTNAANADEVFLKTRLPAELISKDATSKKSSDALKFVVDNIDPIKIDNYVFTLKLSMNKFVRTHPIAYCDFCVRNCDFGEVNRKQLRLYDVEYNFLGVCVLEVSFPEFKEFGCGSDNIISAKVLEPIMDDIASLSQRYTPKNLRRIDLTVLKSVDPRGLHRLLRQQLASNVLATVYVGIVNVELFKDKANKATATHSDHRVSAKVGNYSASVDRIMDSENKLLPLGMYSTKLSALRFPLMRVDISCRDAQVVLQLKVFEILKNKQVELGQVEVSLRALLSPKCYTMSELITLPIVSFKHGSNQIDTKQQGNITFALYPPAYESYPSPVRFSSHVLSDFNRPFVRYYEDRIRKFLERYDPNSLMKYHSTIYDVYVANKNWKNGLPQYLFDLVEKWGHEVGNFGTPPPLEE